MLESYRTLSADEADWWSRRDAAETARRLAEFYTARGRQGEAAKYAARPGKYAARPR